MELFGQVGLQVISDGMQGTLRIGRMADLIVSEYRGRFAEAASRGMVFSASVSGLTYLATMNTPLSAGTGVPVIGVLNPTTSPRNLEIIAAIVASTSGTPGGPFHLNVIPNPTGITAAATGNIISHNSFQAAGSQAKAYITALTGSAAATYLRPLGGPGAAAVGAGNNHVYEDLGGQIIVTPGSFVGIAGTAVGSSHVISAALIWQEVYP